MSHDEVGGDERKNSLKSTRDETRSTYVGGRKSGIRTMGKGKASVKSNGKGGDNVTCRKRYILEDRERERKSARKRERNMEIRIRKGASGRGREGATVPQGR